MAAWRKNPIEYIAPQEDLVFLSIVFTWHLQAARTRAVWRSGQGYRVLAGGPAVYAMPEMMVDVAGIVDAWPKALPLHNPDATFTTRGCPNRCGFCTVPRIEGPFRELSSWEWQPKPVICDNNFLASSRRHFDEVIDRLKSWRARNPCPPRTIDFNQGLDAALLKPYHAHRLAELQPMARLAWDHVNQETLIHHAYGLLRKAGFHPRAIGIFALIGYDDDPDDAAYRLQSIANLPAQPFPMRYQPLDALDKSAYVHPNWTEEELRRFMHYWTRYHYHAKIPFAEYRRPRKKRLTLPSNRVTFDTILGEVGP